MIEAKDAVIWVNDDTRQVMVKPHGWGVPEDRAALRAGHWTDPIGAAYSEWHAMSDNLRVTLMLETVIDLATQGFPIATVLRAFNEIKEFHALGRKSYPMCRALTSALVGKCLEANTMSFDELLIRYAPGRQAS
jgi:hypothetical protein